MDNQYRIACIGAGNVSSHLLPAFNNAGHRIVQVISRSALSAQRLAEPFGADFSNEITKLDSSADILFLTVPDRVLPELIDEVSWFRGIVVHVSGSMPLSSFRYTKSHYGVFYPLQTFSRDRNLDFKTIPVFIEGSNQSVTDALSGLGQQISDKVYVLDSENRAFLHLAAVFANNFTNYLLTSASDILLRSGIERNVLDSLIRETLEKAIDPNQKDTQTGPAVRGDLVTIKKHLNLLSFSDELMEIYQSLSASIQKKYSAREKGDK